MLRQGPLAGAFLLLLPLAALAAEPSVTGQTGLISMPDARFAPEGSWRTGLSYLQPYEALWSDVTFFPWLEADFRYTRIMHTPGFTTPGTHYGDYKDKSVDGKLLLLPERGWWPALAVGAQDVGGGTGLFKAYYGVASKRLGDLDLTLGYGTERIDGAFGGVRWSPQAAPNWSVVAEYDAYDYPHDFRAAESGAADLKKGPAVGVEYHRDWWGVKAFRSHGDAGINAYVNVPLMAKSFAPKINEPPPFTRVVPRPTEAQWEADPSHRERLVRALAGQDFRDIRVGYENGKLSAVLTNTRISAMPRAVGRAARTMLAFAPLETHELVVTWLEGSLPLATYDFTDASLLREYFNGMASLERLEPYVEVRYARPEVARNQASDRREALKAAAAPLPTSITVGHQGADLVSLKGTNVAGGSLAVSPWVSTYLNDPSGAIKFETGVLARWSRPLALHTFLDAETRYTVWENVSDVTEPSNSTLPHVRTDIAEYERGRRFKLTRLLVNHYWMPATRVYARASAGIYEQMFAGAGGQVLWLPESGGWAFDVASDWVRQRDFRGWFGFRPYRVLTTIASFHYRMSQGVTATLRGGRFLAGDEGVRGEVKRRFRSGVEVGAWYTVTNGNDITSPGTPSNPYHDKGVFVLIPLESMLTYDTQATGLFALSPWTRDVGQMVESPGDLYGLVERPVAEMREEGGLGGFGEMNQDYYRVPALGVPEERRWPDFLVGDWRGAEDHASRVDWPRAAFLAGGITLASAALDKRAYDFAERHRNNRWVKRGVDFGNALPFVAVAASGLFAFDTSRPQLNDAGIAALEAGGLALVADEGLKYAFGRARPTAGMGPSHFRAGASQDRFHSFPSRHATVMWAAVTPYAEAFDAPWLYGVAAITNAARVGSREHWLSDTVGGALLGYTLGHLTWQAREDARLAKGPQVSVGPQSVNLAWRFQ